jgi:hypothetical protein
MAYQKHHSSLESLRSLVKTAAEILLETGHLKACIET